MGKKKNERKTGKKNLQVYATQGKENILPFQISTI